MTYKINRTDGLLIAEVIDGTVNQVATDITLVGKNVSGYGEFINENFVKILENFANTNQPNNPITGQLWFDTTENKLKVYDGTIFKNSGSPIVSSSQPTNLIQGDLWIDSIENQLYFYDGTDLQLAGPIYKQTQGITGFISETITDTTGINRVILQLWVGDVLLGIFSKETVQFTPREAISGFNTEIFPGFNQSTLPGLKFHTTATLAEKIVGFNGESKTFEAFMSTERNTSTIGTISINNNIPLKIGPSQNYSLAADSGALQFRSDVSGQDFLFVTKPDVLTTNNALVIRSVNKRVGVFKNDPDYTLDIGTESGAAGSLRANSIKATSSFKLPQYSTTDRDNLTLTSDNYGEMIYNTTDGKVQAYVTPGTWVDLH